MGHVSTKPPHAIYDFSASLPAVSDDEADHYFIPLSDQNVTESSPSCYKKSLGVALIATGCFVGAGLGTVLRKCGTDKGAEADFALLVLGISLASLGYWITKNNA